MKKVSLYSVLALALIFNSGKAYSAVSGWGELFTAPPDSNRLIQIPVSSTRELNVGEVFITAGMGYGDMTIAGSPIANTLFNEEYNNYSYGNLYNTTIFPEYGGTIDYLATETMSMGVGISYQPINYTSTNIQQGYNQYIEYPYSVSFSRLNIGMRNLFYFRAKNSDNLHVYMGARAGLSIWNEVDNWANGTSNYNGYRPIINSSDNTHVSVQLIWGMRYFIVPDFGMQLEVALGTPYYAQFGITIKLNDNPVTYSVTKSEYRAMNEGNQLTHRDSATLGLLHPQAAPKK